MKLKITKDNCKKIIKLLVTLFVLGAVAYGLVYTPMKQLEIAKGNLIINDQTIKISEAKDIKRCQLIAGQQIQAAEETAKKDGKELSEEEKKQIAENTYLNCLSLEARDYIVNQILAEQKKAEEAIDSQKENK